MALSFWEASLAASARRAGCPFSSVLMLGRQTSLLDPLTTGHIGRLYDVDLQGLEQQAWAEPFFQRLGASRVDSLDYCDYEGASLIHDMNRPWPEGQPPERFDIVFDGGTLEHVFNLPQALINAMSLVKPGGSLLSVSPADGWLSHGFYQLQPELFFRFLTPANGFRMRGVWLAEFGAPPAKARLFQILDPAVSGCRPQVPGRRPLSILVHATKLTEPCSALTWPGQSNYTAMWQEPASKDMTTAPISPVDGIKRQLMTCLPKALLEPLRAWSWRRARARQARASHQEVCRIQPFPQE